MWEKIDEIYPKGGTYLDGIYYTNEEIKRNEINKIISYIQRPVREMLENQMKYTYYPNGDMTAETIYNVFPPKMVDNIPLLNVYAQRMLNTILEEKYG